MRWTIATVVLLAGCGYPEFGFREGPAPPEDVSVVADAPADVAAMDDSRIEDSAFDAGQTEAGDASTADAASESSVADVKMDAIVDTRPDTPVETAPPTFCATAPLHVFCADWDSSTEPTFGWAGFSTNGGGTLALDALSVSAPRSFLAQFPAGAMNVSASVSRLLTAPTIDSIARVDLRVRLGAASYPDGVMLVKLQRAGGRGVSLWLGSAGFYAEALGTSYSAHPLTKPVSANTWYHLRMETNLKVSGATLRVYVDDMNAPLVNVSDVSTIDVAGTDVDLITGLYASHGTSLGTGFAARYDNVTLDWL